MSFDPIALAMMKKQLPCYDTRKTAPLSLSHDGNIDGLEGIYFPCYETTYYKISETVPTYEESIQGTGVFRYFVEGLQDEETPFTTAAPIGDFSHFWLVEHDNATVPICFFLSKDTVFPGGTLWGFETDTKVTKGIWIVSTCGEMEGVGQYEMFVKSLYFPSVTTGELKTIDPKFLPEPFEVWFSAEDLEGKGYARGYRASDFTEENLLLPDEVYEAYKVGRPLHVRCSSTTIGEEAEWYRLPILGIIALPTESGDEGCMEFIIKTSLSPFGSGATSLAIVEIDIYAE